MKNKRTSACWAIAWVLSIVILGGCESNELTNYRQENLQLQKTIDDQKFTIENLELAREAALQLLFGASEDFENCQDELEKAKLTIRAYEKTKHMKPNDVRKGLAELEAMRQERAKWLKERAAAKADPNKAEESD